MPVLAVNSLGVNAAMSFICGLSTMATLIEPVPEAGLPLDPELESFEPPPPQPTAITPVPANNAATDQRRRVPLMGPLLLLQRGGRESSATDSGYSVGLCGMSSQDAIHSKVEQDLSPWTA